MTLTEDIALWIIAISLATQAILGIRAALQSKTTFKRLDAMQNKGQEHAPIKTAMEDGRYAEAVALALERQKVKPGDAYAWYYAGMCYHHMKEWEKALEQFRQAQFMIPTWEEKFTGPYIHLIEQKLKGSKA